VVLLEGGYDLQGLAHSVAGTFQALTGIDAQDSERPATVREIPFAVASARARAVRRIVSESWQL
jgi:acetoin utilization deacetylase AcuC-like enzyme